MFENFCKKSVEKRYLILDNSSCKDYLCIDCVFRKCDSGYSERSDEKPSLIGRGESEDVATPHKTPGVSTISVVERGLGGLKWSFEWKSTRRHPNDWVSRIISLDLVLEFNSQFIPDFLILKVFLNSQFLHSMVCSANRHEFLKSWVLVEVLLKSLVQKRSSYDSSKCPILETATFELRIAGTRMPSTNGVDWIPNSSNWVLLNSFGLFTFLSRRSKWRF